MDNFELYMNLLKELEVLEKKYNLSPYEVCALQIVGLSEIKKISYKEMLEDLIKYHTNNDTIKETLKEETKLNVVEDIKDDNKLQ